MDEIPRNLARAHGLGSIANLLSALHEDLLPTEIVDPDAEALVVPEIQSTIEELQVHVHLIQAFSFTFRPGTGDLDCPPSSLSSFQQLCWGMRLRFAGGSYASLNECQEHYPRNASLQNYFDGF